MTPEQLCALVPHAGSMCLIDELLNWDAEQLLCRSASHRAPGNPLRDGETLRAIHAVEYAGQASALHGGLLARAQDSGPIQGVLVAAARLEFHVDDLSALSSPLEIQVTRLHGAGQGAIYDYRIGSGGRPVSSGRLTIMGRPESAR